MYPCAANSFIQAVRVFSYKPLDLAARLLTPPFEPIEKLIQAQQLLFAT